ncbi:MAG: hypothetical protein IKK39_05905 [Thermoguttaceae bacterium]|nr:hypothetical protein [Thermoguttaceae bacterium]MBR4103582.1 hypothetical protein [Thermoguttaceae bacterium]
MKSFFRNLSSRFPFFANRPSALERAVRQSPKSRRLRMEPLENRALLAVDAFGGAASLIDSDVGATWGPDPAPAAFSASVLATDAAVIDLSAVDATLADASFSVRTETPEPVAPPSFEQLMESLGMIEIESLDDESDVASASYLDDATDATAATSDAVVRRVVFEGADVDVESLDEPTVVVPLTTGDGESAYNGARSGGENGNSGGEEDLKPFLSGGYGKAGYADFVFSADDANVHTFDVSGWFTNPVYYSPTTYSVVDENLAFVDATLSASSSLQISVVDKKVGVGSFTVRATNMFGSCDVTINVYSGRVVGYELEERVWGGDWSGVEDSGTSESGVGWNLLWRENEYRWKPVFEGEIEPSVLQVRNVVVSATPTNATSASSFATGSYALQYSSGGGTATPSGVPESWPCAIGEPSVNGENAITMSVTLSGASLSDDSRYCVAASNNVTLTQQNTPATVAARPRVAITAVQSVTWEAPEVTNPYTDETIDNAIRLGDDPNMLAAQRIFPEKIFLDDNGNLAGQSQMLVNQVNAKVELTHPIPQGMTGTVYLQYYDPVNTNGSIRQIPQNADGSYVTVGGRRDNNGVMTWLGISSAKVELTFTSDDAYYQTKTFRVSLAHAGDNVILAAHPNDCLDDVYRLDDYYFFSILASPYWPKTSPYYETLISPQLNVWRTLWVECDQMYYRPDANNPETRIEAPKPEITGVTKTAFGKANIDVVEYPYNQTSVFEGYEIFDFSYTASDSYERNVILEGARNAPTATSMFWTARVIGGFWYSEDNDVNESCSGITVARYGNNAFVFNSSNERVIRVDSPSAYTDAQKQAMLALRASAIAAHELGHLFLGANNYVHTEETLMDSDLAPIDLRDALGINLENKSAQNCDIINFSRSDIQRIQNQIHPW